MQNEPVKEITMPETGNKGKNLLETILYKENGPFSAVFDNSDSFSIQLEPETLKMAKLGRELRQKELMLLT